MDRPTITKRANLSELNNNQSSALKTIVKNPTRVDEVIAYFLTPSLAGTAQRAAAKELELKKEPSLAAQASTARAIRRARIDGAISGTSLYAALPGAFVSAICAQVTLVLEIAQIYGHDPNDPARVGELLYFLGKYKDIDSAHSGVELALNPPEKEKTTSSIYGLLATIKQLPELAGVTFKSFKSATRAQKIKMILTYSCMVLPLVGIPFWSYSYSRQTRMLSDAAQNYYGNPNSSSQKVKVNYDSRTFSLSDRIKVGLALASITIILIAATIAIALSGLGLNHRTLLKLFVGEALLVVFSIRLFWLTKTIEFQRKPIH